MSTRKKHNLAAPCPVYRGNDSIERFASGNEGLKACLEPVRTILIAEGYEAKCEFSDELALNLDKYEEAICKGLKRSPTVDFVLGLEREWLLLVEAKFRVSKMENIRRDLPDKIAHSKAILQSQDTFVHCMEAVVVLLKDKDFQQRSNRLRKLLMPRCRQVRPMTVGTLYETYFTSGR